MGDQGLGSWPRRRAAMTPDTAALVQDGTTLTYAELDRAVTAVAHGLAARGVGAGARVAFLGVNSIEMVTAMFAVARLGAVFVPVNTRLAPAELAHVLQHSGASLLLVEDALAGGVPQSPAGALDVVVFVRHGGGGLSALMAADTTPFDEPIGLDDPFMIQYTSGTSGLPKGVVLTHGNVVWNVYNLLVDVDLRSDEVALVTAPLFHTAALNQVLLPTVLKGGTALLEARFDAERAIDLIEAEGVTLLFGVTTMYLALSQAARFADADLTTLRNALSGGAPIPESLLHTWLDRGLMIVQGYGLTEASPGVTMLRAADGVRKLGSAGTACFFTDVGVIVGERAADIGEPGEVIVRGPNVSPGYWRDDAATALAYRNGWLHTGDLATTDEQGYLRIVDRLKDMYISGGENVYPAEVEQALYANPAVAECAVIGAPDPTWGEVGRAFVVVRDGEHLDTAGVLRHLEPRLARYKLPRSVEFVPELPHNASGKLLKSVLRKVVR